MLNFYVFSHVSRLLLSRCPNIGKSRGRYWPNKRKRKKKLCINFVSVFVNFPIYIYLISCIPIISKIKPSTLINQSPKDVIILFMYLHNVIPGNILVTSGDYGFFCYRADFLVQGNKFDTCFLFPTFTPTNALIRYINFLCLHCNQVH